MRLDLSSSNSGELSFSASPLFSFASAKTHPCFFCFCFFFPLCLSSLERTDVGRRSPVPDYCGERRRRRRRVGRRAPPGVAVQEDGRRRLVQLHGSSPQSRVSPVRAPRVEFRSASHQPVFNSSTRRRRVLNPSVRVRAEETTAYLKQRLTNIVPRLTMQKRASISAKYRRSELFIA